MWDWRLELHPPAEAGEGSALASMTLKELWPRRCKLIDQLLERLAFVLTARFVRGVAAAPCGGPGFGLLRCLVCGIDVAGSGVYQQGGHRGGDVDLARGRQP